VPGKKGRGVKKGSTKYLTIRRVGGGLEEGPQEEERGAVGEIQKAERGFLKVFSRSSQKILEKEESVEEEILLRKRIKRGSPEDPKKGLSQSVKGIELLNPGDMALKF